MFPFADCYQLNPCQIVENGDILGDCCFIHECGSQPIYVDCIELFDPVRKKNARCINSYKKYPSAQL